MQNTLLSSLSLLMIANGTIKSSHMMNNQFNMNLAILPHSFLSTITFQNLYFQQIKLIHFTPVVLKNCIFSSAPVFIESKETLNIKNCLNLSGYIKVEDRGVFVQSTNLSEHFTMFHLMNANGTFQNSNFTKKSKNPVIYCSNSEVLVQNCSFSNCNDGGIFATLHTNLTVTDSIFHKIKSCEGSAIYFIGDHLIINRCHFQECFASESGGALKIFGNLNSSLSFCSFKMNKSPLGNSIYCSKLIQITIDNCFIPNTQNEIYYAKNIIPKLGDISVPPVHTDLPLSESIEPSHSSTNTNSPSRESSNIHFTPREIIPSPTDNKSDSRNQKLLIFIIVVCAAVVIIAIIAVIAVILHKKKSQIYPSDYDGENEEPKKTTVVVPNINDA